MRSLGAGAVLVGGAAGCDGDPPPEARIGDAVFARDDFAGTAQGWSERWLNLRYAGDLRRSDGVGIIGFPPARKSAVTTDREQTKYLNHPVIMPSQQAARVRVTVDVQLGGLLEAGLIARASCDEAYALLVGREEALLCRYTVYNRWVLASAPMPDTSGWMSLELEVTDELRASVLTTSDSVEISAGQDDPLPSGFVGVVANPLDDQSPTVARFRNFKAFSDERVDFRADEMLYRFVGAIVPDGSSFKAQVTARTVIPQAISFEVARDVEFTTPESSGPHAPLGNLGAVKAWLSDLEASTTYHWRPVFTSRGEPIRGPAASFRTPPPTGGGAKFIFASCTSGRVDKYPSFATMAAQQAAFVLHAGDWGYADLNSVSNSPDHFQARWIRLLRTSEGRRLTRTTPLMFWQDDHDYDADNGWAATVKPYAVNAFDELHANPRDDYFDLRWGDVHVWCLDCRLHATNPAAPDDRNKSRIGLEQKTWLKRGMADSDAPVKVVASPMVFRNKDPDDPGWHTVYTTDRDELLGFFATLPGVVFILSGDAHGQRLIHHFEFGELYEINCSGTDFAPGGGFQANWDPEHTLAYLTRNAFAVVELDPEGPGREVRISIVDSVDGSPLLQRSFPVG